ncbi:retrovirus-related pol polyprotein from transposon TNT 1-94 [Tanacetum coccineum]|uniref:Retrovirus-related pol polyprotein from transposon TNT 1-94 n=1 Tax=Tanacetum coccineum TaxID=301880 RepID=A0ABQ5B321_9ASTR
MISMMLRLVFPPWWGVTHEYLNDLEEEYEARALLTKSKRFFKKDTQRFSSAKATDQTEYHKCGKKGHLHKPELRPTKDFKVKYNKVKAKLALLSSSALASKASTVKNKGLIAEAYEWDEKKVSLDDIEMVEVKVFMALAEENDVVSKESTRNGEWVKISMRKVHTLLEMEDNDDTKTYLDYLCIDLNYIEEQRNNLLSKHRNLVHELNACKERLLVLKQAKLDFLTTHHVNTEILKENKNLRTELKELTAITETRLNNPSSSGQKDLIFVKSSADDTNVSIPGVERPWLSEAEGFILPNHDTGRILPTESQRNTTDPSVAVTDSSATDYDSADESSVCSTPLPPLKKLDGAEPISGPKTIKSILRSKSTFKAETLKGVIINEPSSALAKDNKSSSASKVNSAPAGKLKSVKIKDDPPLAIVIKELNNLKLQFSKSQSSYSRSNQPLQDYLFRKRDQSKKSSPMHSKDVKLVVAQLIPPLISMILNGSKECDIRKPIWYLDSGCSRHMTGVKNYLHKYMEQPGPKVVFGDDSTYTTEGYGSIKCNGIVFTKFDEKRGTIFNSNKEVVMIAPRVRDVYVLDMTSCAQESCFFAKASENLNWLWHKRLAHLNFKTINKLAKKILLLVFPHLSTQKINHVHRVKRESIIGPASKQNRHLLSRYVFIFFTWIYLDLNNILVNFCDEKRISQNFFSPYKPEQNGVAKRKNRTLIEAARKMLSGSVFSKQYWIEAVAIVIL